MQRMFRPIAIIAIACLMAYGQSPLPAAERELFLSVNQARKASGLPALRWDSSLATAARRHADVMAQHGAAQHGFQGEPNLSARAKQAGAHFGWISENIIHGSSPSGIHAQFMQSLLHRANILDPEMDSIGVGVVEQGGELFAVEDFAQAR